MAEGDRQTESRIAVASDAAARPRLSLLVMGELGVSTYPLPERGTVTIGRAERCEVPISDSQLSREHARILLGDDVRILDLGSSNGTRVGDRQIAPNLPVVLALGDVISLGRTVVVLQPTSAERRPRQLWSHGYFESRLEEECARAETRKMTFAVLRVRFGVTSPPSVLEARLSESLGPEPVVGSYAPAEYEALLADVSPEDAEQRASDLAVTLTAAGTSPEVGVACYPRDGRTPEALVARAGRRHRLPDAPLTDGPPSHIPAYGAISRLRPIVERFAVGTIPVLVLGETGVGKDVLATMIHHLSPRAARPFVCLNCAALPECLFESELFGHERGAFTGATSAKAGLLESASGGTVFLDELAEMPLSAQAKLLRVIDQSEVLRLGATRPRSIDVRFVAATNRDLEREVERGSFRQDLYFRLNAAVIVVPPLRERIGEIAPLAATFVAQACRDLGRTPAPKISAEAMALLERHSWPGNIRELRNAMERAVLLARDHDIGVAELAHEKMGRKLPGAGEPRSSPSLPPPPMPSGLPGATRIPSVAPPPSFAPVSTRPPSFAPVSTRPPSFAPVAARPPSFAPPSPYDPFSAARATTQRSATIPLHVQSRVASAVARDPEAAKLVAVLDACDWNQSRAAIELGISRRTLVSHLSAYGLTRRRGPA